MARRNEESPLFDALQELLKLTPIWVGPAVALSAFLVVRYLAPHFFAETPDGAGVGFLVRPLLPMLAWILAGVVLVAWLAAEADKFWSRRLLDAQRGIETIRALPWPQFELLVCEAYRRKGYLAEAVGGASADGGVDVELRGFGETLLVQCKQWRTYTVGVRTVRELLGVVTSRRATGGILVTSGRFTADAVRFAEQNPQIRLVAGPELAELIASVQQRAAEKTAVPVGVSVAPAPSSSAVDAPPICAACGSGMVRRTARRGSHAGSDFWGCSRYPACRSTKPA